MIKWRPVLILLVLEIFVTLSWLAYHEYQPGILVQFGFEDYGFAFSILQAFILIVTPPLAEEGINACELQKMYFHPKARGRGFGKKLIQLCLEKAKELAYSHVYLETLEEMHEARSLYESVGFKYIDHRMGATGHSSCPVFMLKYL